MTCPNCKATVPDHATVCEYCGRPLSADPGAGGNPYTAAGGFPQAGNTNAAGKPSGNRGIVAALAAICAVLVLVVAVLAFVVVKRSGNDPAATDGSLTASTGAGTELTRDDEQKALLVNRTDPSIRHKTPPAADPESNTVVYRSDSLLFSCITDTYAPDGNIRCTLDTVCTDAETGRALALDDLVYDTDRLSRMVTDALFSKYDNLAFGRKDYEPQKKDDVLERVQDLMEGRTPDADAMFGYAPSFLGLVLKFETGALMPPDDGKIYYAEDFLTVTIPYAEDTDLFIPEYTALPENFVTQLESGAEYLLDIDAEPFAFRATFGQEESDYGYYLNGTCDLEIAGGKTQTLAEYDTGLGRGHRPDFSDLPPSPSRGTLYLVRHSGNYYLWIQYEEITAIGTWNQLLGYTVRDNGCRYLGMTEDFFAHGQYTPLDPENLVLTRYWYMGRFGDTISASSVMDASCKDGMPVKEKAVYDMTDETGFYTNTTLVLTDAETGGERTVPPGSRMFMTETDGETYVILNVPEGGFSVRIPMTDGDVTTIGGQEWYEALSPGWDLYLHPDGLGSDGRDPYETLVEEMARIIASGNENAWSLDLPPGMTGLLEMNTDGEGLEKIGYCTTDLDGDGTEELLLLDMTSAGMCGHRLLALFTKVNFEPELVAEAWYRNALYVLNDGKIFHTGSGGAAYSIFAVYALEKNSMEFAVQDYYFTDFENDTSDEPIWFHNTTGNWDVKESEKANMTYDEAWEMQDRYLRNTRLFTDAKPLGTILD